MKYRPEIDGLRALAVFPVIMFHAGFELFSGGFVGVDIFFVISGYLITTILIEDIENNRFSVLNFYERRARRILPALFFILIICIPFAWLWMLPGQMKDFSAAIFSISVFLSNFYFMSQLDYFAPVAELNPLLHTWSLSVEEQFYLFFPPLLLLFFKRSRRLAFISLCVMFLLSFIFSEWAWRENPERSFFFSLNRFWELFSGSITAFIVQKKGIQKSNTLSSLGLSAILLSIFFYDQGTPFPSFYALLPVGGVILLIIFASKETLVARMLSTKVFVGLGLISYSAYLWHQPLFAFARIRLINEPSVWTMLFLSVTSLFLAALSWRYVEKPFRDKKVSRKIIFKTFPVVSICFILFGLYGYKSEGFYSSMLNLQYSGDRSVETKQVFEAINYDMYKHMAKSGCKLWARNTQFLDLKQIELCKSKFGKAIIVLGDSHAMNLFNIISYSGTYPFVIGVSQGGCRAHKSKKTCHYDNFQKFAKEQPNLIKLVLYHQSGSYFIMDIDNLVDSNKAFKDGFLKYETQSVSNLINYLDEFSIEANFPVLWLGPFLEYRWQLDRKIFFDEMYSVNPKSVELFEGLEEVIQAMVTEKESFYYESYNTLFFEPKVSFIKDCFMFRDKDHFSKCGEKLIAKELPPNFLDRFF